MAKAFGIDISKWNASADGTKKVNFDMIKAHEEEVLFVAARAGVSWGYKDPQFDYHWEQMARIRICRIAYHVIYFGESALAQMDYLFKLLQNKVDWAHDRIALDLEVAEINTRERITATTLKCLDIVKARTGRFPIVYSRADWVDRYLNVSVLPNLDWWLAQYRYALPYPLYTPEHPGPPTLPKGVNNWMIHQTAEKGKGIGTVSYYCDYNRWNGEKAAALRYFGYEVPDEPQPEPEKVLFRAKCVISALYKRSGPSSNYPVVGSLALGDEVDVYEVSPDGWFRIEENSQVWCSGHERYMQKISDEPEPEPEPDPQNPLFQAKCVISALYKRSGPAATFPVVGTLMQGDVVDVYEVKDGWYRIAANTQVWCSGYPSYMVRVEPAPEIGEALFQAECIVSSLYKRSRPASTYPSVGYLVNGQVVNVYEELHGWYRIEKDQQVWCSGSTTYMKRL